LIRLGAFALGAIALGTWKRPWQQDVLAYQVEAWLWTAMGGVLAVVLAEPFRRRMKSQDQLDRTEEDALDDDTMRRLRRNRRLCFLLVEAAVCVGMAYLFWSRGWDQSLEFAAGMTALALVVGLFVGEFVLTLDPRQALYSRRMARRR
jgi:hypothetical protein